MTDSAAERIDVTLCVYMFRVSTSNNELLSGWAIEDGMDRKPVLFVDRRCAGQIGLTNVEYLSGRHESIIPRSRNEFLEKGIWHRLPTWIDRARYRTATTTSARMN